MGCAESKGGSSARATEIKMVVVGDEFRVRGSLGAAAKTTMCFMFAKGAKNWPPADGYLPTVFDNYTAQMYLDDGKTLVTCSLWDTQGQQEYQRTRKLSYPHTDVFLCCINLLDAESFNVLKNELIPEIRQEAGQVPIVIVGLGAEERDFIVYGNDTSQINNVLTSAKARELSQSISAAHYTEVSLVTGSGVPGVYFDAMNAALTYRDPKRFSKLRSFSLNELRSNSKDLLYLNDTEYGSEIHKRYDEMLGPIDSKLLATQTALMKSGKVLGVSAVAFEVLLHIHEIDKTKKTRQVVAECVIPNTNAEYYQYLIGRRDNFGQPLLGAATHFASHAWDYTFQSLVDALALHSQFHYSASTNGDRPFYWCDLFIKNQHRAAPSNEEFQNAITGTLHTVCVLDTLEKQPVALTRIWCLYEYLHTLANDHELQVFLPTGMLQSHVKEPSDDRSLAEQLLGHGVDVSQATASRMEDVASIQAEIMDTLGSFENMNEKIKEALLLGVERACSNFRTHKERLIQFTDIAQ